MCSVVSGGFLVLLFVTKWLRDQLIGGDIE